MVLVIWNSVNEDSVKSPASLQNQVTGQRGRFCNYFFQFFGNAGSQEEYLLCIDDDDRIATWQVLRGTVKN